MSGFGLGHRVSWLIWAGSFAAMILGLQVSAGDPSERRGSYGSHGCFAAKLAV